MPTMRLPAAVAGIGTKCTLVLMDRVIECELSEAHINAVIKTVSGDAQFVDESLLVKFKILTQQQIDTTKAGALRQAMQQVLNDRSKRQIELE